LPSNEGQINYTIMQLQILPRFNI